MKTPVINKTSKKKLPKYSDGLSADGMYDIQRGDNLTNIAKRYNTTVEDIMKNNSYIKDPNLIYAGKQLNLGFTRPQPAPAPVQPIAKPNLKEAIRTNYAAAPKPTYDTTTVAKPETVEADGRTFMIDESGAYERFGVHKKPIGKPQTKEQRRAALREYVKNSRR